MSDADLLRIPVGPGAVHVERYGFGGPAIVLLHGFGTSSFVWRRIAPELAVAGFTAFAVDLLGFGESDRPLDAPYGVLAQAEYVDRAMTAFRVANATLVGLDFGAVVALALAAARPERADRLVLVNPVDHTELPGQDVRALQRNGARFAFRASRDLLGVAPLLTPILEAGVADPARMPPRLVARYLAPYVGGEGVTHLLSLARSVQADELEELDLATVGTPTLLVRGEEDRWADDDVVHRYLEGLPSCRVERIAGVGRLVPEEAPDRLAELVGAFAAGREVGTPAGAPAVVAAAPTAPAGSDIPTESGVTEPLE